MPGLVRHGVCVVATRCPETSVQPILRPVTRPQLNAKMVLQPELQEPGKPVGHMPRSQFGADVVWTIMEYSPV